MICHEAHWFNETIANPSGFIISRSINYYTFDTVRLPQCIIKKANTYHMKNEKQDSIKPADALGIFNINI